MVDTIGSNEGADRGTRSHALGEELLRQFNMMYRPEDLEAAIVAYKTAIDASPAGSPQESAYRLAAAYALQQRFALRGETSDCDAAVAMLQAVLSGERRIGIPSNQRGVLLVGLGLALKERYLATGDTSSLIAAAAAFRASASDMRSSDPFRAQLLSGLGHALSLLYRFTANEAYRAEALRVYTQVAESILVEQSLRNKASAARSQLRLHSGVGLLPESAVRCGELAEEAAQARVNYRSSGELNELNRAITFTRLLLPLSSPDDSDYVHHLVLLGEDLLERYERTGWDDDPGEALTAATKAEEAASGPHSLAAALCTVANAWLAIHHLTNDREALDHAIAGATRSLEVAPADEPGRAWSHNALGISLMRRYEDSSDVHDARRGAESFRQALTIAGPASPRRRSILNNLAAALRGIYEHTAELWALDEAIEILRTAAGERSSVAELANLGNAYMNRYYLTTDTADVDRARNAYQCALEGLPPSDISYPIVVRGLFEVVTSEPGRDPNSLGQAIRCVDDIIKVRPSDGVWHHRRGILLRERFQGTGSREDLQEAVKAGRRAAELTPSGHRKRFNVLAGLAYALRDRYEQLYDLEDLVEAEALARQCIAGLPTRSSLALAVRLFLKIILEARLEAAPGMPVQVEVLRLASEISASPAAPPLVRALEARDAAVLHAKKGDWRHAAEHYELAVTLLPFVAPDHDLREGVRVLQPGRTAADGAACWLNAEEPQPGRAAVLLELGRAVFLSRTSSRRADLARLRAEQEDLADKFEMLRTRLERPDRPEVTMAGLWEKPGPVVDQAVAAAELETVLATIRGLPGHERFLLPLNVDELCAVGTEGPIVMLNVSTYRCDALILTSQGVRMVPLRGVTLRDVADKAVHIQMAAVNAYDWRRPEADQKYLQKHAAETLTWLWDKVVEPVVEEIGITGRRTGGRWPRIWWITGGVFTWLPIHAAGHHDRRNAADAPALLDRAQSSYVPSVSMLIQARARARQATETGKVVIVAMPKTPGKIDLPSAEAEAQAIANRFPATILGTAQHAQRAATRTAVISALARHPIVHFACHAEGDWADSWGSFFAIQSDQPEAADAVGELRLTDIASLDLQKHLACLSACATTRPTDIKLLDEALHLTSGFLLAGFAHISGTLWEVEDDASAEFARKMYEYLEAGPSVIDSARAALAVHEANLVLRESYIAAPLLWASHIHVGP